MYQAIKIDATEMRGTFQTALKTTSRKAISDWGSPVIKPTNHRGSMLEANQQLIGLTLDDLKSL